jgi:hypothetical protein
VRVSRGLYPTKYVESWPSTTSAWAGWSRFDIPMDRYGGVHYLPICTAVYWDLLPATRLASIIILIEKNIKSGQGQHSVFSMSFILEKLYRRTALQYPSVHYTGLYGYIPSIVKTHTYRYRDQMNGKDFYKGFPPYNVHIWATVRLTTF